MTCSRCTAEAVVKRGNAAYCAKCAMARDWEDIIAIVQEERVDMSASEPIAGQASEPVKAAAAPAPKPEEASPATEPAAVAAEANGGGADLPADPFA